MLGSDIDRTVRNSIGLMQQWPPDQDGLSGISNTGSRTSDRKRWRLFVKSRREHWCVSYGNSEGADPVRRVTWPPSSGQVDEQPESAQLPPGPSPLFGLTGSQACALGTMQNPNTNMKQISQRLGLNIRSNDNQVVQKLNSVNFFKFALASGVTFL